MKKLILSTLVAVGLIVSAGAGEIYSWNKWQQPYFNQNLSDSNQNFIYATDAFGTITDTNGIVVELHVTGEIGPRSDWIQRPLENSGWNNPVAYTSSKVYNLPPDGDQIGTYGGFSPHFRLTFSKPVLNPVLNIYSLGSYDTTGSYCFNQSFSIISSDTTATISHQITSGSNTYSLSGNEWNGTILFTGTYTELSWTVTSPEYFSAWKVGVESVQEKNILYLLEQPKDVQLNDLKIQNASFNVVATNGIPPYAYQWMKDGVDLTNQTNASLVLSNAGANTVGYYSCDVTDQTGTTVTSSNAALNISGVPFWLWQGLVAYYPFNGDFKDATGHLQMASNFGTYFVANRFGENNGAIGFNGSQYLGIHGLGSLLSGSASGISISGWYLIQNGKDSPWGYDSGFIQGPNIGQQNPRPSIRIYVEGNSKIIAGDFGQWGPITDPATTTVLPVGSWHQITAVMKVGNIPTIYLDGVPSQWDSGRPPSILTNPIVFDSDYGIGNEFDNGTPWYADHSIGSVSDFRFYNRALSSNEVAQLYTLESTTSSTSQAISFPLLAPVIYGAPPVSLTASASSGLPISYSSTSTNISISGNIVTVLGTGTATIVASQSGNSTYAAAPSITNTLVVNGPDSKLKNQAISFPPLKPRAWTNAPFALTAKASSMLPITYTSSDSTVATISNGILTPVGVGTTTITAYQGGNTIYNPAKPVSQQQVIAQGSQKITFPVITPHTYGDAPFTLSATSTSSLPITYASLTPSVATVFGNVVTIVGAGTAKITASQSGNALYSAATPVSQTLKVAKANQTVIFNPTTPLSYTFGGIIPFSGSASSGLPITYTSSKASVITVGKGSSQGLMLSKGTTTITATQSGNANYNKASATATITLQ